VAVSLAVTVGAQQSFYDNVSFNGSVYTWMVSDGIRFEVAFLIDRLPALMMTV